MGDVAIVFSNDSSKLTPNKIIEIMEKAKPLFEDIPDVKIHATINETAHKIRQAIDKKPRAEISLKTIKLLNELPAEANRNIRMRRAEDVCKSLIRDLGIDVPEQLGILIKEMEAEV